MLGWHISIYRQTNPNTSPAPFDSAQGTRVAVWQTGLGGLDWIKELVGQHKAIDLGGNGYPCRFTAVAGDLLPRIADEPPGAKRVWTSGLGDILTDKWEGRTVIDRAPAAECRADEWLLIEAWDES